MSIKTEIIIVSMIFLDISGLPLGSYFFFLANCLFLYYSLLLYEVLKVYLVKKYGDWFLVHFFLF